MDLVSQRAETEEVFKSISEKFDIPPKVLLYLQFVPMRDESVWAQLLVEAKSIGYDAEWVPDDDDDAPEETGYIEFSVVVMRPDVEVIWEHEKQLTVLADSFGFAPDGWGFLVPKD